MKIISEGTNYRIFDSSIQTFNQIPAGVYSVGFSKQSGWFLTRTAEDIDIREKVYGVHDAKTNKVLRSFQRATRNLGVILSGDKGIGKSLFAKLLSHKIIEAGIPLIIIDTYIPGIASFISSIDQEIVCLFDEFDKTFKAKRNEEDSATDPQTEMLSLFDGVDGGKKLFIVTCNDLHNLSDFIVNRPGRFHYHFRFNYPGVAEITAYLKDKGIVDEVQIKKVVDFSQKVKLNYDCLRAIVFELQDGSDFSEAIADMNIMNTEDENYQIITYFTNGEHFKTYDILDMFDDETYYDIEDDMGAIGTVTFDPTMAAYDSSCGGYVIKGEDIKWELSNYYNRSKEHIQELRESSASSSNELARKCERFKALEPMYAIIKHDYGKNLHFTV